MSSTAITLPSSTSALQPVNRMSALTAQSKPLPSVPGSAKPQTPISYSPRPSTQPGTWRHPKIDDISRRQNRAVFSSENARSAIQNGALLLASFLSPTIVSSFAPKFLSQMASSLNPFDVWLMFAIRIFFFANFLFAFRPLIASKDEIDDIPLTPSQRALLGLKPSSTPLTPGSQFVTPPRYSRSATPRSSASDRAVSGSPLSGSPLSGRGRSGSMDRSIGSGNRAASGSPYSGSPLVRGALTGSAGRRLSFDTIGGSSSSGLPSTPTPSFGTGRASVGLNNKWLYERSRGSPSGRNLFS